ncbi:MAG TPA: helix-turn-helix domain-containing protein [Jatrophihabitans sp.]|jgi:transposase-like protein|nr:helix-turn-helix domain-containing protein [Jatrophihabitans sp.]
MTKPIRKGARLVGAEREKFQKKIVSMYNKKTPIRDIADQTGRSYGAIHRMLSEAGVTFRPRGGATRGKKRRG